MYRSSQSQAVLQSGVSLQRKSYVAQRESTEIMSTAVMRRLATLLYDFTLQLPVRRKVVSILEIPSAGATENLRPCNPAHTPPPPKVEQKVRPPSPPRISRGRCRAHTDVCQEPEMKARKKKSNFWLAMCCTR